jgi:hypothetical protein
LGRRFIRQVVRAVVGHEIRVDQPEVKKRHPAEFAIPVPI